MSFVNSIQKFYDTIVNSIIRPPREIYKLEDLGSRNFLCGEIRAKRTDFTLLNKRNLKLACSFFEAENEEEYTEKQSCIVYLHGNCSSRIEALKYVDLVLSSGMSLFCFDFSGCGHSQGDYVSLGFYEKFDVQTVVEFLRHSKKIVNIGLWGRSMGAVTGLLYSQMDPSITSLVVDSPFSSFEQLMLDLGDKKTSIPRIFIYGLFYLIRSTVKEKAGFDLTDLEPIKQIGKCYVPIFFIVSKNDKLIDKKHTEKLFSKYPGDKNMLVCEGDHNTNRPNYVLDSISIFFHNTILSLKYVIKQRPSLLTKKISQKNVEMDDTAIEDD